MRAPLGFGKNYFTLSAITATVNHVTLHAISTRTQKFHIASYEDSEQLKEEEEPTLLELLALSLKPCQCRCYAKAKKAIKHHTTYKIKPQIFIILDTSLAPPPLIFNINI